MTINYQQPFPQYPGPGVPPYNPGSIPLYNEQSYIENILRLNRGKQATIYMSFEGSQWGSKIFKGEVLEAGKDHIILADTVTGVNYLLLTIYLSYITFDEPINYEYPYSNV